MEKKTTRNCTAEETNLFCSILVDPVTKFMLTLEQKALKKAATEEIFEAILEELETAFMEEPFKNLSKQSLKGKESLNLDIKKLQRKYNNLKQLWRKLKDKKKNGSDLTRAQDPTRFQILNPVLSDTANTSLSDFFRQEEGNKAHFISCAERSRTYLFLPKHGSAQLIKWNSS